MKTDASRRAIERTVDMASRIRKLVNERLPYGPTRASLTPAEWRKRLGEMPDEAREVLAKSVGAEEWEEILRRTYGAKESR